MLSQELHMNLASCLTSHMTSRLQSKTPIVTWLGPEWRAAIAADVSISKVFLLVQITAAPPMPMGPPGGNRGFGQPQFGQRQ